MSRLARLAQGGHKLRAEIGARKILDVKELHPEVLAKLKIDPDTAIADQKRIDAEKRQAADYFAQQGAIIASRSRQDAISAEERALKRRELDVQETVAKVQQLKIEEDKAKRAEEKTRQTDAAKVKQ